MPPTRSPKSQPYPALAKALHGLKATRDGFEGLTAALIDAASGGRLDLMSSGDQAGVDGIEPRRSVAPRRAMQAKQYAQSTALNMNALQGEMDRAQQKFAGLDCWIMASTKTVRGKEQEELAVHADSKGWGLVVIDWTPFAGLPRLATLCAAHRSITDHYVTDPVAQAELEAIEAHAAFEDAVRALRRDLAASDVGFEPARAAAASLIDEIFQDRAAARRLAGPSPVFLSQAPPVERPAVAKAVTDWLGSDQKALALLAGEGMGKTWAALAAMRELGSTPGGPLAIVIPSHRAALANNGLDAVLEALREVNADGVHDDPTAFWRRRLAIWAAGRGEGPQPRLLVLIDGLDELDQFDWDTWLAPLLQSRLGGLCRLILACRADDWRLWARPRDLDSNDRLEFPVPRFEPPERDAYLISQGVSLAEVSPSVLEDALHPRTAFHVARLGRDIGDYARITRELILLHDFSNRYELKKGPLDPSAFERIVIGLARRAEQAVLSQQPFTATSGSIVQAAVDLTGHDPGAMRRVLSELVSGGWVRRTTTSPHELTFEDRALPLAVGMALADEIRALPLSNALAEVDRLLEPWGADDLIEPVLRSCATVLVTGDAQDALCRHILRRWAALRFHSREAEDFWRRLHGFRPDLFLDLVEAGATGTDWLGEWGLACLWGDQPGCAARVERRLQYWLSRIGLPRERSYENAGLEAHLNRDLRRQRLRLRGLEQRGGAGWIDLLGSEVSPTVSPFHRAARTLGFLPRAPFMPAFVAWALSASAAGRRYGFKEVAALLRDNDRDWPASMVALDDAVVALEASGLGLARTAAALLLEATGRPADADRAVALRPRPARRIKPPLLTRRDDTLDYTAPPPDPDGPLIPALQPACADPDARLTPAVQAALNRIAAGLGPSDIPLWLDKRTSTPIMPLLRWARPRALDLIRGHLLEGPPAEEDFGKTYAEVALSVFPILAADDAATTADHLDAGNATAATALKLLPLAYPEQFDLLMDRQDAWPDAIRSLLKRPNWQDYRARLRDLDFAGPTAPLNAALRLLIQASPPGRDDDAAGDLDWSQAFSHADDEVQNPVFSLAEFLGGETAARALAASGWRADPKDRIRAYTGSAILGALPDETLRPLVPNLSGEYALVLIDKRPALRAEAEALIWTWIHETLETRHESHGMGASYCRYARRDTAFSDLVARHTDRVHALLATVWSEPALKYNLLFDDGEGPGWPLLRALADREPEFVKTVWRGAMDRDHGLFWGSVSDFPLGLPEGDGFNDLRRMTLEDARTDEALFKAIWSLQRKGHEPLALAVIGERLDSDRPIDRAWGVAAASFLNPTPAARALWNGRLSATPGAGWLGEVHDKARETFGAALNMAAWWEVVKTAPEEADAWCAFRLLRSRVDERYVDLVGARGDAFDDKPARTAWLNAINSEEREDRKAAFKALGKTWLFGQRYQDVIQGR